MNRRNQVMLVALAATLAATLWVSGLEEDEGGSGGGSGTEAGSADTGRRASRSDEARRRTDQQVATALAALDGHRPALPELTRDPFAPQSFQPPPPPPPPPPKPVAPPLRFKYLGRLQEDQNGAVFLSDGAQTLVVRAGDTVGGQYRIEKIGDHAITFEYLPLKQQQTLTY